MQTSGFCYTNRSVIPTDAYIDVPYNNASFNTLNIFYEKLAGEFQKKGHETSFIDLMDDGAISDLYRLLDTGKYDIVFSINSIGEGGIRLPNGKNIYDNFHIPFLEMLLDHPLDHIGYIEFRK